MDNINSAQPARRAILKSLVRAGLMLGLGGIAGLALGGRSRTASADACGFENPCAQCGRLKNCDLPQALAERSGKPDGSQILR